MDLHRDNAGAMLEPHTIDKAASEALEVLADAVEAAKGLATWRSLSHVAAKDRQSAISTFAGSCLPLADRTALPSLAMSSVLLLDKPEDFPDHRETRMPLLQLTGVMRRA